MKSTLSLSFSCLLLACLPLACSTPTPGDESEAFAEANLETVPTIPVLPAAGGTGDLTPWGGADASKWRPEAILANAASEAMNAGWSRSGVNDVVVAIPLKLWSSGFFE